MRNYALLLALLCSGAWIAAQRMPQSKAANSQTPVPGNTSGQKMYQGCLAKSKGAYVLTGNSDELFRVVGDETEFSGHIGQKVRIMGEPTHSAAKLPSALKTSPPAIEVTRLTELSGTCGGNR